MAQPEDTSEAEAAFGRMVRERRGDLGWTQEQLRRRLLNTHGIDLSKTAMSRLEQGERPIRLNEVHALAKLLGIDMAGFGANPRTPERAASNEHVARALMLTHERLESVQRELEDRRTQRQMLETSILQVDSQIARLDARRGELMRMVNQLTNGSETPELAVEIEYELLHDDGSGERVDLSHLSVPPQRWDPVRDGER